MAGVYTRDNINYSTMLQNAIANRNAAAQREAAYEQAKGKLWGDTVNNITKYAGRGIMASADQYSTDEDEAELERLKALKAKEIYDNSVGEINKYNPNLMNADRTMPRVANPQLQDEDEYWNYYKQQRDYKDYMDSIYDPNYVKNDTGKEEAVKAYIDATYGSPTYKHPNVEITEPSLEYKLKSFDNPEVSARLSREPYTYRDIYGYRGR